MSSQQPAQEVDPLIHFLLIHEQFPDVDHIKMEKEEISFILKSLCRFEFYTVFFFNVLLFAGSQF